MEQSDLSSRTRRIRRQTQSPRDNTPIVINGEQVDRSTLATPRSSVPVASVSPRVQPTPITLTPRSSRPVSVRQVETATPRRSVRSARADTTTQVTQILSSSPRVSSRPPLIVDTRTSARPPVSTPRTIHRPPTDPTHGRVSTRIPPPQYSSGREPSIHTPRMRKSQREEIVIPIRKPGSIMSDEEYAIYDTLPPYAQAQQRELYIARLNVQRISRTELDIPPTSDVESLSTLVKRYDYTVRHIMVANKADGYRKYLFLYWLGLEALSTKYLNINASGYSNYCVSTLVDYDDMLMELGEKNFDSSFNDWPVEVRIMLLSLYNLVIFVAAQYLSSWIGADSASIRSILSDKLSRGGLQDTGLGASNVTNLLGMFTGMASGMMAPPAPTTTNTETPTREYRPRYED